jgi:hypothetical protein
MNFHLAQINIGRLVAPLDDPKIAAFVAQLDPINALADAAPGFVWRLQSASGNATELAYNDDPFVIVNMSVWTSVEACATTSTRPGTSRLFAIAPSGLKKWTSLTTVSGGFPPATSRASRRAASVWSATSSTVLRRTPSGSPSSFPPRCKRSHVLNNLSESPKLSF